MSICPRVRALSTPLTPPLNRLDVALLAGLFHRAASIGGTGKKRVSGEYADTRLGKSVTLGWANERFRQTMLLIFEFRTNWGTGNILSNDDVEFVRICLDVALSQAVQQGHTASDYDMSPTVWACWLVQHCLATRSGGWQVESMQQQLRWSFAGMYVFLEAMHARGDRQIIRDPLTKQVLHRYKLPFKAMHVPPKPTHIFKWRRGARQLSDWMVAGGLTPLDPGIIEQRAPTIVPPPQLASRRANLAAAMWHRIGLTAGRYQLQSLGQGGSGGDDDAEETRQIVRGIMREARCRWGRRHEQRGCGRHGARARGRARAAAGRGRRALEVTAQYDGPLPQQAGQPLVEHIAQLLEELQQQGVNLEPGEPSPAGQQVLNELRDELRDELDGPSSSGAGSSGAGPSGSSGDGAGPSVSS